MMRELRRTGLAACAVAVMAFPVFAGAQPGNGEKQGHSMGGMMKAMPHGMGHGKARGGHLFGPHWRASLTDDQKAEIDWMHLRLRREQHVLKAEISLKKAELKGLVTGEDMSTEDLRAKVDELLELKREYLLNKYQHMVEMRQVLTPQQRVSFDLGVLSRRHGGGHR